MNRAPGFAPHRSVRWVACLALLVTALGPWRALSAAAATNVYVVTTTLDSLCNGTGAVSLRCALTEANTTPALSTAVIDFNIPGCSSTSPCLVDPTSDLPSITASNVTVNGYSQPGSRANTLLIGNNASPTVQLDGSSDGGSAGHGNGMVLAGGNDIVEGLSFTSWGTGIVAKGVGDAASGDLFGVSPSGAATGTGTSVYGDHATTFTLGGSTLANHNLMANNIYGGVELYLDSGDTIAGNWMTNNHADLTLFETSHTTVGGTTSTARNVLSGNHITAGVYGAEDTYTTIEGNYIGTTPDGIHVDPNYLSGILLTNSMHDTIGGLTPAARNIIAGSLTINNSGGEGVYLDEGANNNTIVGNWIGVNVTMTPLPNVDNGVLIENSSDQNTVANNVIASNGHDGVQVGMTATDVSTGNVLSGNSIYANGAGGIALTGQGTCSNGPVLGSPNDDFPCPRITADLGIGLCGTGRPGATVEVFVADNGEGRWPIGTTTVGATGAWCLFPGIPLFGVTVVATQTGFGPSGQAETSQFSSAASPFMQL